MIEIQLTIRILSQRVHPCLLIQIFRLVEEAKEWEGQKQPCPSLLSRVFLKEDGQDIWTSPIPEPVGLTQRPRVKRQGRQGWGLPGHT